MADGDEKVDEVQYKAGYDYCMAGGTVRALVNKIDAAPGGAGDIAQFSYAVGFADAVLTLLRKG